MKQLHFISIWSTNSLRQIIVISVYEGVEMTIQFITYLRKMIYEIIVLSWISVYIIQFLCYYVCHIRLWYGYIKPYPYHIPVTDNQSL